MMERVNLGFHRLDKIQLPSKISEVAFWVDYACIDQDNPKAGNIHRYFDARAYLEPYG